MSKFCYEEGEIELVECQCELCVYYNDGARSEVCPKEQLDEIIHNTIFCPNLKEKTFFEFDE